MAQRLMSFARIFQNLSTRILLELGLFVLAMAIGFVIYTYNTQIESYKDAEFKKLDSIAKTLTYQINGEAHEAMFEQYTSKDALASKTEDESYFHVHELLKGAKAANNLGTDIYTLVKSEAGLLEFGVTSSTSMYYRHVWSDPINEIYEGYQSGARIGPYVSSKGTWLSAIEPIKNEANETVAVVQVDQEFGGFITMVRNKVLMNVAIIALVLVVLLAYMFFHIRRILIKDDEMKKEMIAINLDIEEKNRDINDSINSAKNIQMAMFTTVDEIKKSFPEMFIMFQPRDIVSGDFFWYSKKECRSYFAVADCTGHGVPGAFMSMVGNTILNEIISSKKGITPAEILQELNKKVSNTLYKKDGSGSSDGMDIGLCCFDHDKSTLEFSGALRPLVYVSGDEMVKVRADRFAIGGNRRDDKNFTNKIIDVKEGDTLYMYSDGYHDQFGGAKGKKYQSKRFRDLLMDVNSLHIDDQKYMLQYEFHLWKDTEEQVDDVLVAGFKIPAKAHNLKVSA